MDTAQIVEELEEAARQLGMEVRHERGAFQGGACQIEGQEIVMLNKRHPPEAHLALLADSLREQPVDQIYLKPAVRAALEDLWARRAEAEG